MVFARKRTNDSAISANSAVSAISAMSTAETMVEPTTTTTQSSTIDVAATSGAEVGIKPWYEPEQPAVDIVFVHGLNGHFEKTWTAKGAPGPWPKTLLPKRIPDARILTYGYSSAVANWWGPVADNMVKDHAKNMLAALAAYRQEDGSTERPIIFVGHSLGGIVVKDAILHSVISADRHLAKVVEHTHAIAFLGTPHTGSSLAPWAERISRALGALGKQSNIRITQVLRRDSETLGRIGDDFLEVLRRRGGDREISVTCFYEEVPMAGVGEVVSHSSATLPGYPAIGIPANHRDMARFSSASDPGFISAVGELRRWTNEIREEAAAAAAAAAVIPVNQEDWSHHHNNTHLESRQESVNAAYTGGSVTTGDINIYGTVFQSSIVNGSQVIQGGLTFGALP